VLQASTRSCGCASCGRGLDVELDSDWIDDHTVETIDVFL
jgi:hypothetical protein